MVELEEIDRSILAGDRGRAAAYAMGLLVRYGEAIGAERFVSIASAHIDGCLYHGPSGIEFVRRFADLGGRVCVPTTLNSVAVDTLHPGLYLGPPGLLAAQKQLIALHVALGCMPTLTCAPYQRAARPQFGQHIAWGESNAIVFANSVLGARTDRYGDFSDLCAALTGRVPLAGLHCEEQRLARVIVDVERYRDDEPRDVYFAAIGYVLGSRAAGKVPLLIGLPDNTTEDELKALGAAAASSGAIGLFHALGITPEARSLAQALGDRAVGRAAQITKCDIQAVVRRLCGIEVGEPVAALCLGTPHYSRAEFARFMELAAGRRAAPGVEVYISTSRNIAEEIASMPGYSILAAFGVQIVVDTCTYFSAVVRSESGAIVTNSAKFAHYAPGNLRRRVGLMTLERCVSSAVEGRVTAA